VEKGDDGGFLAQFAELVDKLAPPRGCLFPGCWHKDHVSLHVSGGLVVLAVRDLPAEVRHQQGRMQHPADAVIENLGLAEGLVAALVCKNPDAGAEEALQHRIQPPEHSSYGCRGNIARSHKRVEQVKGCGQGGKVAEDVVEARDS
jgi:hypothetical protein